ncbi:MAG: hypothetical protein ACLQIB_18870 [Isosphaeraceae bacterium]
MSAPGPPRRTTPGADATGLAVTLARGTTPGADATGLANTLANTPGADATGLAMKLRNGFFQALTTHT